MVKVQGESVKGLGFDEVRMRACNGDLATSGGVVRSSGKGFALDHPEEHDWALFHAIAACLAFAPGTERK